MRLALPAACLALAACAPHVEPATIPAAAPPPAAPASVEAAPAAPAKPRLPPVTVELYVMSQCPYGVQAENAFGAAIDRLGDAIDLKVDWIGERGAHGELISMHGPREVRGDRVQACAQQVSTRWFELVRCQNKNAREVDTNWEECAADLHMPVDRIRACADGALGDRLLAASFERARLKGTRSSPTIYIAGQPYQGGRRAVELMRAVCGAYGDEKPRACADVPIPPPVNVTILADRRCGDCPDLRKAVGRVVAAPVFRVLDYGDDAGKQLFADIQPAKLPAAMFDATLDADREAAAQIAPLLDDRNGRRVFARGDWNPLCHDDGGCKLDDCQSEIVCRKEIPKKLDVFMMSQCPFAVKGMNAMKDVLENFDKHGAKLDFTVHFIGDGDASSLSSMHGSDEVAEDVREACAFKYYGKTRAFLKYVWCRNKDIRNDDWRACTGKDTGVEAKVLEKCAETSDEGKKLVEKSFADSKAIGFGASPTWLVNNKFEFSGVDSETIKSAICEHNKLPGCDATLDGAPPKRPNAAKGANAPNAGGNAPNAGGNTPSGGGEAAPAPGCGN